MSRECNLLRKPVAGGMESLPGAERRNGSAVSQYQPDTIAAVWAVMRLKNGKQDARQVAGQDFGRIW